MIEVEPASYTRLFQYSMEHEGHNKSNWLDVFSVGHHVEKEVSSGVRKTPPKQLAIPKTKDQYQHRRRWRHLSDSSAASFQSSGNECATTPEYGATQREDVVISPSNYHHSRKLYLQQSGYDHHRR